MFKAFRSYILAGVMAALVIACGQKKQQQAPIATAEEVIDEPAAHAAVQVRIYHVAQSSYPDGQYQEFGLYIDNHTPDTLCTVTGRLVYCGQNGDTLAFLDFMPAGTCSTAVTLIAGTDTVVGVETFAVYPGKESMESVHFRWKETSSLRTELKSMPDRFSCLWFEK